VRHGTCFRRPLPAHHAGAAPHSAVAELAVVRRLSTLVPKMNPPKPIGWKTKLFGDTRLNSERLRRSLGLGRWLHEHLVYKHKEERKTMSKKIPGHFNILFVAGFGPIVQDVIKSHKFYLDALGLSFQKDGDYLHTDN
jgi:hypothetical protein